MKKAFVIGFPISHSKSPILHGFWLDNYELSGSYQAIEVKPEHLKSFLSSLEGDGFVGGNVTIPHKENVLELVDIADDLATLIGAANTVWLEDGRLRATNTDAYGFLANLDDYSENWREKKIATVLGAGGASRAIIAGLLEAGFKEVRVANRTVARAQALADRFGKKVSAHPLSQSEELFVDTQILVNTTSLGMNGENSEQIPSLDALPDTALVTDIVYNPLMTPLLERAKDQGLATVDGLGMLLHQAVPGFEKWFGVRPEVTRELRERILAS